MEPNPFTHTFTFDFGGVQVSGEVEFTGDIINMDIKQAGVPLKAETMQLILDFFYLTKKITTAGGDIRQIKIKTKAV